MITIKSKGNFKKTSSFLERIKDFSHRVALEKYAQRGVEALAAATPKDSGETAASWYYEIHRGVGRTSIEFFNSNNQNGFPVAIMLQYGHGTGTGGWVEGMDYINPAVQPVFDKILREMWEEVTR